MDFHLLSVAHARRTALRRSRFLLGFFSGESALRADRAAAGFGLRVGNVNFQEIRFRETASRPSRPFPCVRPGRALLEAEPVLESR